MLLLVWRGTEEVARVSPPWTAAVCLKYELVIIVFFDVVSVPSKIGLYNSDFDYSFTLLPDYVAGVKLHSSFDIHLNSL